MHLSKVNIALGHKIVGGSEYQWNCYPEARYIDYESDYAYASVIINTQNQEVYCAEVNDKDNLKKQYRWLNPKYKQAYLDECIKRDIDPNTAWDNITWCDLEVEEDWLEKASAIFFNLPFDTRIQVPLDLDKDELFELMKMAHERDMTLNQMVEYALQEAIDRAQSTKHDPIAL